MHLYVTIILTRTVKCCTASLCNTENISYSSCDIFMFTLLLLRKDYHSSDNNYLQFLFARWELKRSAVI